MLALEASPNDPVFWLHHWNVDRIWAIWEQAHPDAYRPLSGATEGFNLNDRMYPFGEYESDLMTRTGITNASQLDSSSQGVRYQET